MGVKVCALRRSAAISGRGSFWKFKRNFDKVRVFCWCIQLQRQKLCNHAKFQLLRFRSVRARKILYFMIFLLSLYWKVNYFCYFLNKCICKEGNRTVLQNRFSFCAPLKVPRPILRKTWLGLEDKTIFQLKYQFVCPQCFCQFFANNFKKRPKHQV